MENSTEIVAEGNMFKVARFYPTFWWLLLMFVTSESQTNIGKKKQTYVRHRASSLNPSSHCTWPVTIIFISTALKTEEGEAPSFTAPLKDRSIEDGSAARFDVRVRGKPSPAVTWYKDDEEITDEQFPHIKVFREGNLYSILITEGKVEDAGQYKVTAKNDLGEVSSTSNLFVEGV